MKKNTKLIIGILSIVAIICAAAVLVFAGTGKETSEYEKYIEASQKYVDELNYEKAIAELELAIEIEPNNAEAYVALAEVYVQMDDYETAISVLEGAKEKVTDVTSVDEFLRKIKEANLNETSDQILYEIINHENGMTELIGYDQDGNRLKNFFFEANDDTGWHEWYLENIVSKNNRIVKATEFYGNGYSCTSEWDEKGREVKQSTYYEGSLEEYIIREYDEKDIEVKVFFYNGDGSLESIMIPEYDEKGREVKSSSYDANGQLKSYSVYEYDENGNTVKSLIYGADGSLWYSN